MNSIKIINVLLVIVVALFVMLFSLFFFNIYIDYSKTEKVAQIIDASEIIGEVTPIVVPEKKEEIEENKQLIIEPTIRDEEAVEEEVSTNTNEFYYNQLDKYSKLIYKSLKEQ